MLHMLHLPIRPRALMACAREHGHADDRRAADLGYIVHGLLHRLSDPSPKPFDIQAADTKDSTIPVLAYAGSDCMEYRAAACRRGDERALRAIDWDRAASKAMPALLPGQRLGFRLRACPTVRIGKRHPRLSPGAEVDPYVALLQRRLGERLAMVAEGDIKTLACIVRREMPDREAVYRDWLASHLGDGARLVSARLVGQHDAALWRRGEPQSDVARRMHKLERAEHHGRRLIGRREAVFEGVLEVADRDGFAALLARGVGRHRAFGFGMLLLRPAPG